MNVTIIGPGNMGRALTTRLTSGGNRVTLVGRDLRQAEEAASDLRPSANDTGLVRVAATDEAIEQSEVVILALPYEIALDAAREHAARLAGKIVVDITNPLNESQTDLVTSSDRSGAETIRALLPADVRVVKAFNTTFARTLVTGEVSGQALDVFIAGDDDAANERVAGLVRGGGMRPVVVGGIERARQLEALGFLGMSLQEPLGTGYMTGWKLTFPGATTANEEKRFPRNAVVGVLQNTGAVGEIVTELAAVGVEQPLVHLTMGAEGAATLRSAQQSGTGILGAIFGFEAEHTRRHLNEVEAGRVLIIVEVSDDTLAERVGAVLARHGANFVNYYSRWTARSLLA